MPSKPRSVRDGFGDALLELGAQVPEVVALSADLSESVRMHHFAEKYPSRFFELGVAEQNQIGVAAGLAKEGFIPFTGSFAAFSPGRTFDQIRVSVAISGRNVKVVGGHAGLTVGEDGATHQMLEDLAMMRSLPNMSVLIPVDYPSAKALTHLAARMSGPVYLRLSRYSVGDAISEYVSPDAPVKLQQGSKVLIVTSGILTERARQLATLMSNDSGISPAITALLQLKPLNTKVWVEHLSEFDAIVSLEEHQELGGVGSTLAELLGRYSPRPIEIIGVSDRYGTSGSADAVLDAYGFTGQALWDRVGQFLIRHKML